MYNSHLTTNLIIYLHLVKILHKVILSLCSVILDYHSELNLFVNTMPQTQVNHQFQGTNLIFICIFLLKYFNFLHWGILIGTLFTHSLVILVSIHSFMAYIKSLVLVLPSFFLKGMSTPWGELGWMKPLSRSSWI